MYRIGIDRRHPHRDLVAVDDRGRVALAKQLGLRGGAVAGVWLEDPLQDRR